VCRRRRSSAYVTEEEDAGCVKLGGGRDAGHGALCRPVEVHVAMATRTTTGASCSNSGYGKSGLGGDC
jgi:hypothetical protein